jgi:uncharacterized protein YndB with AHSA1/START domain
MTLTDKTAPSQTESLSFELDLHHSPEKVWRALTDPVLLAEWLLPVIDLKLEPGAVFTFKTQPYPGWDGTVNCRLLEVEPQRKLSYAWSVPFLETVVTFTITPTASGTVTVIANFVAMTQGQPPAWITYSPLLPLALLLFSGLYLFVLPYAARWRSARRTE